MQNKSMQSNANKTKQIKTTQCKAKQSNAKQCHYNGSDDNNKYLIGVAPGSFDVFLVLNVFLWGGPVVLHVDPPSRVELRPRGISLIHLFFGHLPCVFINSVPNDQKRVEGGQNQLRPFPGLIQSGAGDLTHDVFFVDMLSS
jgi:hypothetical protein